MLLTPADLAESASTRWTTCVVGGGVAGIALALELGRSGVDVLLLESGGLLATAANDDLARGEARPAGYPVDAHSRARMLGGSSNLWGGWCRPLGRDEVEPPAGVPGEAWPIPYDDLARHYPRTHAVLDLGPDDYSTEHWRGALSGTDAEVLELPDGVETSFNQFSGRHRLAERHLAELTVTPRVRVVLDATVVRLVEAEPVDEGERRRVDHVEVAMPGGVRLTVRAERFVLAAGGIENARLLLASTTQGRPGLGNDYDQVGRCFMDHPRMTLGRVRRGPAMRANPLYDIRTQDRSRRVSADGTMVAANLVLTPEVRAREGLLAARTWLRSSVVGDVGAGPDAVRRVRTDLRTRGRRSGVDPTDLLVAARRTPQVLTYLAGRTVPGLRRRTALEVIAEPTPEPDSRVTLAAARDALGQPRARVDWRFSDDVGHTLRRTAELVAGALAASGAAHVELPPWPEDWRAQVSGTWHHMGTTRMSRDPRSGVVDTDARVHGVTNLYVAGSSVLPRAGSNFPTMTLTALALRLADHLRGLPPG